MFRFLKITMLDCVYVRATSTERRYIACTGLKFIFHNGVKNKHLSGIKKARYLFEPITETHRTAPAVLTLTGANVGIKF